MAEFSLRSNRHRKDLAASFHRMRRMVSDIKSARKSLAAHHSFVAELVSVHLFPGGVPGSPKVLSPQSFPHHPQIADREVASDSLSSQSTLHSVKPAISHPRSFSRNPGLDELHEATSGSPRLQIGDLREAGATYSTLRRTIARSGFAAANSALSSLELLASRISASLPSSVWTRRAHASQTIPSQTSRNSLEEIDTTSNRTITSTCPSKASNPRKLAARDVFWAFLLSAFLCFFLCIGKEIAVGVTVTAYCIIWLAFKGCCFLKQHTLRALSHAPMEPWVHSREPSGHPDRSLSNPTHSKTMVVPFSASHCYTRSRSLPILHGYDEAGAFTSDGSGLSFDSTPSVTSLRSAGMQSAMLKVGVILVLALCGLAHGQIMAVCMCSCWILIYSGMRKFLPKRFKKKALRIRSMADDSLNVAFT